MSAAPSRVLRRRVLGAVATAAALAAVVTVGVRPTFASWVSTAQLGQPVGVASSTCTTPNVYRTTASSRFLAGSVAGVPLTGAAALAALTAGNPASTATFSSGATPRGSDGASGAVANAAIASAVQSAGGVVGLTAPSGSQTQYAAATSTGTSIAGAGSVTNAGAIDLPSGTSGGTLAVSALLGQVAGGTAAAGTLSDIGMSVGRVASAATLNECALRWGAPLSSALTRSSSVSSLSVSARSAAVHSLVAALGTQQDSVSAAFTTARTSTDVSSARAAIGTAAGNDLVAALRATLGAVLSALLGQPTVDVSITGDASDAAVSAQPAVTSGPVTVDGSADGLTVDVAALAGQAPAADTAVLTSADGGTISAASQTAAQQLVSGVRTRWTAAAGGVGISASVRVPLSGLGEVTSRLSGTAAQFAAGTEAVSGPVLTLLPGASLPGVDLTAVTALVAGISAGALTSSSKQATTTWLLAPLTTAITDAGTALTAPLAAFGSAVPSEASTLTSLFSVTLGERSGTGSGPGSSYSVTALHVRVKGGAALDLSVASSSVGPDTTVNQ